MEINQKFRHVTGSFDTVSGEIKCVCSRKHMEVELCFAGTWNIPFAQIKLYDSNLYIDADATFDDAVKLGDEICRRWNECQDKR